MAKPTIPAEVLTKGLTSKNPEARHLARNIAGGVAQGRVGVTGCLLPLSLLVLPLILLVIIR